ncbi:MAG TPA: MipA/OmpV family protein [Rhizobacter sp.]
MNRMWRGVAGWGLMLAAGVANAQAFDAVRLEGPEGQGQGRVGVAAIAGHRYLGSDERRYMLLPTVDYRWANGWFAGVGNGIGYRFGSSPQLQYGLRVTADFGRKENRSEVLRGLGDIPRRPQLGTFLNWQVTRDVSFTSSLRYGSGEDRDGLVLDLGANTGMQLAPRWRLGVGVGVTWVNRAWMQSYFGITPEQSARSGYAVSTVGAGVRDLKASGTLIYFIDRDWAATLAVSASALQGDARDSVIVRERTPVSAVLAVGYRF